MKRTLTSILLAILISIPITIGQIKSQSHTTKERHIQPIIQVENVAQEQPSAEKEYLIPNHEYSFMTPIVAEKPQIEEPQPIADSFTSYDFIPLDANLQTAIFNLCDAHQIDFNLVLAIAFTESSFKTDCVGDNGRAIGLMQIQPEWCQGLADELGLDIWNPINNVELGIVILKSHLVANDGDLSKALKQYNTGNPNYEGTEYTDEVFKNFEMISRGELK